MIREQIPEEVVVEGGFHQGEKEYTHPAFGQVAVVRWTSSHGTRLFGSDLAHRSGLTITLKRAKLRRSLSNDWIGGEETVAEFTMSESQWASLVSSVGMGEGSPVTLNRYMASEQVVAPAIAQPRASRKEIHGQEIEESAREAVVKIQEELARLGSLIQSGKLSKTELKDIHWQMGVAVQNLPGNLKYAMDTFSRATEELVEQANKEIEAHIAGTATRLGLEKMRGAPSLLAVDTQPARIAEQEWTEP